MCYWVTISKLTMTSIYIMRVIVCFQTVISLISEVPPWLCIVDVGERMLLPLASVCCPQVMVDTDATFWLAPCTCTLIQYALYIHTLYKTIYHILGRPDVTLVHFKYGIGSQMYIMSKVASVQSHYLHAKSGILAFIVGLATCTCNC